jgi:protease I
MRKPTIGVVLLTVIGASLAGADTLPAFRPPNQAGAVVVFVPQRLFREEQLEIVRTRLMRADCDLLLAAPDTLIAVGMDHTIIRPDIRLRDVDPDVARALVLVGGSGIIRHWADTTLHALCRGFVERGRLVAAIGLANICLARAGVLDGRAATVFPDRDAIAELDRAGAGYRARPVVVDGPVITGLDAEAARAFSLALVDRLDREAR